jgi:acetolactate synthase-1/2/3 large subunit
MNAAQALVATLQLRRRSDVLRAGRGFLAALDALYDAPAIDVITCRHESGAGLMAVADAKLTGRPGVAFVSRGPGASNAAIALHVAEQDAAPLVLFIGQVERKDRGRGAFQEVDYEKAFGGLCKDVWEVRQGKQLAAVCARAFARAASGIPNPVLVVLPKNVLLDPAPGLAEPLTVDAPPEPRAADVLETARLLAQAERPLAIVGSSLAIADVGRLVEASEAWRLPVALGWKQQHRFPNRHAHYAGHLGYNIPAKHLETLAPADLVLALGTTGRCDHAGLPLPERAAAAQPLVHVHPAREAPDQVHVPTLALHADCGAFLPRAARTRQRAFPEFSAARPMDSGTHGYVEESMRWSGEQAADGVVFGAVAAACDRLLPRDAIMTHARAIFPPGCTAISVSAASSCCSPSAGAMGFGMPAAVAASLRYPQRKACAFWRRRHADDGQRAGHRHSAWR